MWNPKSHLQFLFSTLLCLSIVGCADKDEDLGLTTSGGSLNSFIIDTFSIQVKTIQPTNEAANSGASAYIGSYNSALSGLNSNQLYTSLSPVDLSYRYPSGGVSPVSIKFHARITSSYGVAINQDFGIHQLEEKVKKDIRYTTIDSLKIATAESGTFSLTSSTTGAISADLDLSLAQKIIDVGDLGFTTSETFIDLFKGIAIVPKTMPASQEGMVYGLDADSIYLELVVQDSNNQLDTLSFKTPSATRTFYRTKYDPAGSEAASSFNNDSYSGEFLFIQGLGGASASISFPGIKDWYKNNKVLINKAELVFEVDPTSNTVFSAPSSNLLLHETSAASSVGIQSLSVENSSYTIDIQRLLSSYLVDGKDCIFLLSIINSHTHPELLKLKGPGNASPLKLVLSYTEY